MLNAWPVPGVLTTTSDWMFPSNIKTDNKEGLLLRVFEVDYGRFAKQIQSYIRHKYRGYGTGDQVYFFTFGPEKKIKQIR